MIQGVAQRHAGACRAAKRAAAALLLVLAWPAIAQSAAWPDVPTPEGASSEWVSRHMVYNGIDMRALRFRSDASREDAIAFYTKAWRGKVVRDEVAGKTVLGHHTGGHYVTVELAQDGAATQGTVGIMRLLDGPPARPPGQGFARPAGSEVVNDIRYLDTAREARTLVLRNGISPYANQQFYRQRLGAQGWRATGRGTCGANARACMADFEKDDGSRMRMTIRRDADDRTTVVANLE